jgi:membrane-associated phospholipid phosphatase
MNFYQWIKIILHAIIEKKLPPTISARTLFIFNSMVMIGLGSIINLELIDKYKYKNTYLKLKTNDEFINNLIIYLSNLALELLNRDIKSKLITVFINQNIANLKSNTEYKNFIGCNSQLLELITNDVTYYYNTRNKDGWKESNKQIHLSNPYYINVKLPINTLSMTNLDQWCPLKGQLMLGAKWGDVSGLFNTDKINKYLQKKFTKINIKCEAKKVFDISLTLNPEQKAIAEFWAGIGGSVTPPGFFNMFLYGYFISNPLDNLTQLKYFYKLNCGLFEASIICWGVKYSYLQCRPIQSIRINYPDIPIDYYFGKTTSSLWIPYQEPRLYTPPFPDYISGHSTFSASAATILTQLLGKNLHKLNISLTKDEFKMLSPIFNTMELPSMPITNIIVPAKSSHIVPNTPIKPIELKFDTWEDLAKSAGISRIYGGIHYPSSNTIALKVGAYIGNEILSNSN